MAGECILVVEDEAILAFNMRRILISYGYQVPEPVDSGPDACSAAEKFHPDLVLMDIQLRGTMDGIQTAREIQSRLDIPIIYVTAFAEDARLTQAGQTAPYGFLEKPVQEKELRAAVEMALIRHRLDRKLQESEAAYRELYHRTPAMLMTIDNQGVITQISDYCLQAIGYTREQVIGRKMMDFVTPDTHEAIRAQMVVQRLCAGKACDAECRLLRADGRVLDVYLSAIGVCDPQGKLNHILAALVDITSRKQAEAAERDQRALAEALRDTAAALSSTLRLDEVLERVLTNVGRVVPHDAVNIMLLEDGKAHIERSHGLADMDIEAYELGKPVTLQALPYLSRMAETLQPVVFQDTEQLPDWRLGGIRSYAGAPIVLRRRLLGFINLFARRPNFFQTEHASRLLAFANQAAIAIENAALYAEVQRLATVDELTGIANRRRLFELGEIEFEKARRHHLPLAAILLDIDWFKKVNDTYGHTTGDRVLAGIAQAIDANIRDIDLFGRYGGEEFVVLLPMTGREAALEVANRLMALVAGLQFESERGPFSVTISLGIATLTDETQSLATLIDRADQAMYAAKQAGRCRVEVAA